MLIHFQVDLLLLLLLLPALAICKVFSITLNGNIIEQVMKDTGTYYYGLSK
jgi:hypothetical protein